MHVSLAADDALLLCLAADDALLLWLSVNDTGNSADIGFVIYCYWLQSHGQVVAELDRTRAFAGPGMDSIQWY